MKWEDLRKQAKFILENVPSGDFDDVTFSIRSGTFRIMDGLQIVHRGTSDHYETMDGWTHATHVTVRCRDTGAKDANDRTIYECVDGTVFVFRHRPGSPYFLCFGALESPVLLEDVSKC